jgi:hypothetical protein
MWGLVDQIREYEDKLKRLRGLQRLECCMDSPCGDSGCCSYAVMEPASMVVMCDGQMWRQS